MGAIYTIDSKGQFANCFSYRRIVGIGETLLVKVLNSGPSLSGSSLPHLLTLERKQRFRREFVGYAVEWSATNPGAWTLAAGTTSNSSQKRNTARTQRDDGLSAPGKCVRDLLRVGSADPHLLSWQVLTHSTRRLVLGMPSVRRELEPVS